MSSAVQKISECLKQSSCFKNKLALSIFDADMNALGNCRKNCRIIDALRDRLIEKLNIKVEKFLEKYETMIHNVCNNRRYYLGEESRDCEQFIRMSLCKLYKKRYAYTNFDKVVKSAIKRKAIDFSKARNSSMKMTISETDLMAMIDIEKDGEDIGLWKDEIICEEAVNYDFLLAVLKIRELVQEDVRGIFSEWDKKLLDIICRNVRNGIVNIDDMFDGKENKAELQFRFRVLSKKVGDNFNRSMFL